MERQDVIDKLVDNEIDTIQTMLNNDDSTYLDNIVRNGGILGFSNMTNEDLEEEYFNQFDKKIKIKNL